jgi:hypothetical protein
LKIVKCQKWGRPTKRLIGKSAIGGGVSQKHKGREGHQYTDIICAKKAAARLLKVGPKAIKRHRKVRDVESISHENPLAVEGDNGRTPTNHGNGRVVSHSHLQVLGGGFVGDESRLVQEHVIGSARVSNRESASRVRRDQRII